MIAVTRQATVPGELSISIQAATLKRALTRVIKAVPKSGAIPILSSVRLAATPVQGLTVAATDFEVYLQEHIEAEVHQGGEIILPARMLVTLLGMVPKHEAILLGVNLRTFSAKLSWGDSSYTLHGFDAGQYPRPGQIERQGQLTIQPDALREAYQRVMWSAGFDESRPWLTGVRFRLSAGGVDLTTTNGVTIGRATVPTVGGIGEDELIVPKGAVLRMIESLKGAPDPITLTWGKVTGSEMVNISLAAGDSLVVSRVLEGAYPKVEQLVPSEYPNSVAVNRLALLAALKRLALLTKDGTTHWTIYPDTMYLEGKIPEVGEAEELIPVSNPTLLDELEIGFDARWWIWALSTWTAETIRLEFSGTRKPARFSPIGADDPHDGVILPLITS